MALLDIFPSRRGAVAPHLDPALWPATTSLDGRGRICVGGVALADLADRYGTPVHVLDEDDVRHRCRTYRTAFPDSEIVYAARSAAIRGVADWVTDEGLSLGVSSAGDLALVLSAGIDPRRIILHGSARTAADLSTAVAARVGRIVVGSHIEVLRLASLTRGRQKVLIRHGDAAVHSVLAQPNLVPVGLHCHLGSQIADSRPYGAAVHRLIAQMEQIRRDHGRILTEADLGGGHAVPYRPGDPYLDPTALAREVDDALDDACARNRYPRPTITLEPGRALVARAGVTLRRAASIDTTGEGTTFASVDRGGAGEIRPDDVLATPCTGSHHHGLASTGDGAESPPVVAVRGGAARKL